MLEISTKKAKSQSGKDGKSKTQMLENVESDAAKKPFPGQFKNFLSHILDDTLDEEQRQINPELIRVRNNILIILLVLCAYGVFYLIGDFVDILLTAYIAGLAYQQMRDRFCKIVMSSTTYREESEPFLFRLLKALLLSGLAFVLPRINYTLSNPSKINKIPSFSDYIKSIGRNTSFVVGACEAIIILYILYILLGPYLRKLGLKIRPQRIKLVRFIFAILMIAVTLFGIIVIPSVMFREISSVGFLVQQKIQEKLGCQILAFEDHDNFSLPYCSEKITSENQFIRQTISQFKDQNQTIERCMTFVQDSQTNYIGYKVFDYDEIACTWYTFIEKAGNYSGFLNSQPTAASPDLTNMVSTGTNIFKTFFGKLTLVLGAFSSFVFSFTTFGTMFMLTIQYTDGNNTAIRELFSENKQQLISSITNLIQATFFIVVEHFIASNVLLQIFGYTPINLLISTLLSSMAFFPFFRPWFGILIVAMVRMLVIREYYISLSFVALYYFISQKIYSIHYRKMEIHEILTNMSVLFGIYRFGIAGIFYGPLIIILYKFIEKELLMKELRSKNRQPRESTFISSISK